jgi:hypothetical protein
MCEVPYCAQQVLYRCVLSPMDFDVCYLIVGTLSLDIYTYIYYMSCGHAQDS